MKVAVIGTGRVGLPLALSLLEAGADVVGVDIDERVRHAVNVERKMPFLERGFDELVARGTLRIVPTVAEAGDPDYFVVTVGTPLLHHIETDLSAVTKVVMDIARAARPGQCVIMRSTTAPRTTSYVQTLLERETKLKVGQDLLLACCPERIAEGKAREELRSLPQITGTQDERSAQAAARLFGLLGVEILHADFLAAELAKLANNVSRYAYFATANVLAMIAMEHGAEPYEVLRLANFNYPRPIQGKPGFTAGTCLRKDFGMLSEAYWSADILIESWRINESMPKFLVDATKKRWGSLQEERVSVLGYAFKKDTDDTRDTLASKLLRYVHRECPRSISVHDHFIDPAHLEPLEGLSFTASLESALESATMLFVATNHTLYSQRKDQILERVKSGQMKAIDLWNCLETGRVFLDAEALS